MTLPGQPALLGLAWLGLGLAWLGFDNLLYIQGTYKETFEEIGSRKGLYFAEKAPQISKIAPRAINVLKIQVFACLIFCCSFGKTMADQKLKSKYH